MCFRLPCQNILVISKYYARITLKRLAELLCLSVQVSNTGNDYVLKDYLWEMIVFIVFG